jgi:hypothetical protein
LSDSLTRLICFSKSSSSRDDSPESSPLPVISTSSSSVGEVLKF